MNDKRGGASVEDVSRRCRVVDGAGSVCRDYGASMRDDGPLPSILFVVISLTLVAACYFMIQAPQPTSPGIESMPAEGRQMCTSYLGTPYDC
jgi:hypothetical protein